MGENLGSKVKHGIFWTFGERISSKGIQFLLQLVLARILVPEDYGLCALLLAFVNIATVLINSGLNTALIQKKNSDSIDFSSVFYVSLILACSLYALLFLCAPSIANFFNDTRISLLLRVISITLIIGSFNSIQVAYLTKQFNFRKLFIGNFVGVLISAIASILMALNNLGVWAIVGQYVINRIIVTITLLFLVRWRPKWEFSISRVQNLWKFGWKCMMSSLLSTIVTDIYTTVVGKFYTKTQLGAYDTGNKIPSTVSETFTSSLGSVLFPAFTTLQDNTELLKYYVKKANKISSFLMVPLMFILIVMSESIIKIILTDKWLIAVPFMQMACLIYALYPIHSANLQAINAIGRSDIALKVEIQKKIVDLSLLAIMVNFSIYWVALGRVVTSIIALWINMRPNKKFLNYSFKEQIVDISPTIIISAIVATCIYIMGLYSHFNLFATVFTQIIMAIGLYLLISYFFNRNLLNIVFQDIIKLKNR